MEIELKRQSLRGFGAICTEKISGEFSTEAVVPDTMPDILRILDACAAVYSRGRTVSDGKAMLEGEIHGTVLYTGEDGDDIRKLELRMPCSLVLEEESIREDDRIISDFRLSSVSARAVNPRKVELTAVCTAMVSIYREELLEIPTGIEAEEIQTRVEKRNLGYIAAIQQKSFAAAEEMSLPAAKPDVDTLLCWKTDSAIEELKPVAGKLILQGNVRLQVWYLDPEGKPQQEFFSIPFSQILDLPEEGGTPQITLSPDACYVEAVAGTYGASALHVETHLTAQAVITAEREIPVLIDAYSLRHPCTMETKPVLLTETLRPVTLRETLRELLETGETPSEVLFSRADVGSPEWEEGEITVPVALSVLYKNDRGQIFSVRRPAEVRFPLPVGEGEKLTLEPVACGEPYLTLSGGSIEFRLPMELRGSLSRSAGQELISAVQLDETTDVRLKEAPSLTLVRLGGEDLWTLAKRYGSTEEMICAVNPETKTGDLLLIPRAR